MLECMKWDFCRTLIGMGVLAAALGGLLLSCSPKPPATREDRLKWNLTTLTNDYESAGRKSPKWDQAAREALTEFARSRTASVDDALVLNDLAGSVSESAVAAGCDDPMVAYLAVRYGANARERPFAQRQELYRAAASNLQNSAYAPLRKFYADVDAAEILYVRRNTNVWPLVSQLRNDALGNLNAAYQDKTLPEAEAYLAAESLFDLLQHNPHELTNAYNTLAATLSSGGAKPAVAALVKAEFYSQYAWVGRGHGTADQVTDEQWRMFRERLALAEQGLKTAWSRDPYDAQIPTLMISIATGQQKKRSDMEVWFERAMKLNPENYEACRAKLHYLLPQWYGSREDMLAFGRECVAHTNWGGEVPLILVDAHSEFARGLSADARRDYWSQPDVWPDIKAAYERFAQTEPDATRFRYPYAAYAVRCGQWPDFSEQIKLIRQNDGHVNAAYFGGQETFEKLLAVAAQTASAQNPTNAPPQ
jgi:hypothetical protein